MMPVPMNPIAEQDWTEKGDFDMSIRARDRLVLRSLPEPFAVGLGKA